MILPVLYHWSPAARRDDILRAGLVPGSAACIASGVLRYICLSPNPARAWQLSGATGWGDADEWDLWQVRIGDDDEVHIRPMFGAEVEEVTVRNVIPPDRLWWVGRRSAEGV